MKTAKNLCAGCERPLRVGSGRRAHVLDAAGEMKRGRVCGRFFKSALKVVPARVEVPAAPVGGFLGSVLGGGPVPAPAMVGERVLMAVEVDGKEAAAGGTWCGGAGGAGSPCPTCGGTRRYTGEAPPWRKPRG